MKRLGILLLSCGLLFAAYQCRALLLPPLAKWLDVGETPRRCDYVVTLPGGQQTRPFVTAAIMNAGLAREALIIQAINSPETDDGLTPPEHELARRVLERRGVPPAKIRMLAGVSTTTFTDAEALLQFLTPQKPQTVMVVTTQFHSRRARWVFDQVLGNTGHEIIFVSSPDDRFDEDHWWQTRAGLIAYLTEYAKVAYYPFRYTPIRACLVSAIPIVIGFWLVRRRRHRRLTARDSPSDTTP